MLMWLMWEIPVVSLLAAYWSGGDLSCWLLIDQSGVGLVVMISGNLWGQGGGIICQLAGGHWLLSCS